MAIPLSPSKLFSWNRPECTPNRRPRATIRRVSESFGLPVESATRSRHTSAAARDLSRKRAHRNLGRKVKEAFGPWTTQESSRAVLRATEDQPCEAMSDRDEAWFAPLAIDADEVTIRRRARTALPVERDHARLGVSITPLEIPRTRSNGWGIFFLRCFEITLHVVSYSLNVTSNNGVGVELSLLVPQERGNDLTDSFGAGGPTCRRGNSSARCSSCVPLGSDQTPKYYVLPLTFFAH
jgi:hypothetical protein